jgi:hypothetical protein
MRECGAEEDAGVVVRLTRTAFPRKLWDVVGNLEEGERAILEGPPASRQVAKLARRQAGVGSLIALSIVELEREVAEGVGFEPTVAFRPLRFSSPLRPLHPVRKT